jgi:DNA-binding response OmpR family regulator
MYGNAHRNDDFDDRRSYFLPRVVLLGSLSVGSFAPLSGRSVLVVEDEPLIALDIVEGFRAAGASVFCAHNLRDGLRLAGHPDLAAAVVDFGLSDGEGTALCERLSERGVPFVLHSGYEHISDACRRGTVVPKPAAPQQLISTIEKLLET